MRLWLPVLVLSGCSMFDSRRERPDLVNPNVHEDCDDPFIYYVDDDFDGYGRTDAVIESCVELVAGNSLRDGDCDDDDDGIYPGAIEVCDGVDRDCNGLVDDEAVDAPSWHPDQDLDGFAEASDARAIEACAQPDGYVFEALATDCDDDDPAVYPGAPDAACDGIDQDCSGGVDTEVAQVSGRSFPSLQSALAANGDGERIWVCAGEHPISPTSHPKGLSLHGVGLAKEVVLTAITGRPFDVSGPLLDLKNLSVEGGIAAGEDGGAIRARVHTATFDNLIFRNNRADGRGGALYVELDDTNDSAMTISNVEGVDNRALGDGGFASLRLGGISFISASGMELHRNQSGGHGGAVRITGIRDTQELVVTDTNASDNTAVGDGGTFNLTGNRHAVMIGGSLNIVGGSAARGGHIYVDAPEDGKLDLRKSVLRGGSATVAGGLLHHRGPGTLDSGLFDVTLSDGRAPIGGLYWLEVGSTGHMDWLRADLNNGEASSGAALYITGSSRPFDGQLDVVTIRDNSGGPALQVDPDFAFSVDAGFELSDTSIIRNAAGGISVPSHVYVDLLRTDLGNGTTDNSLFDLRQGTATHDWSSTTTTSCVDGVCE